MKTWQRVCSGAAAIIMAGSLAACGDGSGGGNARDDAEKTVTLRLASHNVGKADDGKVLAEINKRLETLLPHTKLEFVPQSPTNWQMWMSAKESIDIAWTGFSYNMEDEIYKKSFLELDDLIKENAPNIQREMQEYAADYESGKYDGIQYMIPNQQPILNETRILKMPAELYEGGYMDVDALLKACHASPTTTEEVYQIIDRYFEKITAANAVDTDTVTASCDIQPIFRFLATRGYDWVGGGEYRGAWMVYEAFDDNPTVVDFMETDAYKLFIKYAARWYEKGYIAKDIITSGAGTGRRLPTLNAHSSGMWFGLDEEKNEQGEKRGVRYIRDADGTITEYQLNLDTHEQVFNGTSIFGSEQTYLVIPFTAANPARAMRFLDLLRDEKGTPGNDLLNLLVYGIEGEHYTLRDTDEVVAKGYTIQPDASAPYGVTNWSIANVFLTYRTPNILRGQAEYAKNFENVEKPKLHTTPLAGFRANVKQLNGKIAQVQQVITEYNDRLICGVDKGGYESIYNEMLAKMKAADIESIATDLNKQASEYRNRG